MHAFQDSLFQTIGGIPATGRGRIVRSTDAKYASRAQAGTGSGPDHHRQRAQDSGVVALEETGRDGDQGKPLADPVISGRQEPDRLGPQDTVEGRKMRLTVFAPELGQRAERDEAAEIGSCPDAGEVVFATEAGVASPVD
jgi:hypothetical protein